MAKQSGLGDRLYVGGYDLSGDIGSIQRVGGGPNALDLTDITQSAFDREGGLRTGGIEYTAWFNPTAGRAHSQLKLLPTGNTLTTYCRGNALGSPAASCFGKQIGYDGSRGADAAFSLGVSVQSDGFGLEWGRQLTAGLRTDTAATNGASVDHGAATAFGGQFYLHLTAFTGTSVVVKVQDSADNSAWADLASATFTSATGITSERLGLFNGATVRRYLRVATTGTFSNAVFVVNGIRNEIANQVF